MSERGSRFQFTPNGLIEILEDGSRVAVRGGAASEIVKPTTVSVTQPASVPHPTASTVKPITPKDVVKMAKRRLREVRREIKQLTKLRKEEQELTRLIDAAEGKQLAVVRDIKRTAK